MNKEMKNLAIMAGAPEEVIDTLWFTIFCQQFADILITEMENEDFGSKS